MRDASGAAEEATAERHGHGHGPDAGERGGQNGSELGDSSAAQPRDERDRPRIARRLFHVHFVADVRHEPVAMLDHVPREQRVARFVGDEQRPLADERKEEQRRHEDRQGPVRPWPLLGVSGSVRVLRQ
jgi:hypothetical protein